MTGPIARDSRAHRASQRTLAEDEVHLWRVALPSVDREAGTVDRYLSREERERFGGYHEPAARSRAVRARGLLRLILAEYTHAEPGELEFKYGARGKPSLKVPPHDGAFGFNLAHSGDLLLVAVGRTDTVGIDVERIRTIGRMDAIASRVFSADERQTIARQPNDLRTRAFFNCWTRREAYAKAIGDGVWETIGRVEVSSAPDEAARLLTVEGSAERAAGWTVFHLEPAPGYVGALAVGGTGWKLTMPRFPWQRNGRVEDRRHSGAAENE